MMTDAPTTDDIVLDRAIRVMLGHAMHRADCKRCVDWAVGMLAAGFDTDALCRLAGQMPPYDEASIVNLRDRVLAQLGFDDLSAASICRAIANILQRGASDQTMLRETLNHARVLYGKRYADDLQPLYLLSLALQDMEQFGDQQYVDGMTRGNAKTMAQGIVEEFVERYAGTP